MPHSFFDVPTPTILGHRGSAADRPENTVPSFEHALEVGAHILESDVHVTRDGIPVLSHDPTLERVSGSPQRIDALDLEAVQAVDAAYAFAGPDHTFPLRGRGITVPTLREAFETFPGARFNLEIKASQPQLVAAVVDLIGLFDRAGHTLLAAADDDVMARIRETTRERGIQPAIGASLRDVLAFIESAVAQTRPDSDSMALQIPTEFAGKPLITHDLVKHAHSHGAVVHAWTINDEHEMERLIDLGVDGIVTDHPARMRARFHPA